MLADLGRVEVTAGIEQPIDWKYTVENYETELTLPMKARSGFLQPGQQAEEPFAADFWWSGTSSVEIGGEETDLRNSWASPPGCRTPFREAHGKNWVQLREFPGFKRPGQDGFHSRDRLDHGDVSLDAAWPSHR